eukprot:CAMPEP_0197524248 /NCGR_PEP_ID=MMETSP1318-20131121/8978_1 /TAXON_ID=552666 /ORGANISM="Partenskyella glossopodia, Strain RCC365" /LENGTH=53 /DNA_ID=CAMNT_0043077163 /DNA_START=309 /DNA_END=470 /DNA_ORIENTATION=+
MKKVNPMVPILVREAEGIEPTVTARFDKGLEASISMTDMNEKTIGSKFKDLCN